MKILHISTFFGGGAGRAAFRLHTSLLESGASSRMLVMDLPPNAQAPEVYNYTEGNFFKKIQVRLDGSLSKQMKIENYLKTSPQAAFEYFSFPFSIVDITASPHFEWADVINLHWISNYVDIEHLLKKATQKGKKVVWTFHDMGAFTGGCHYAADCPNYQTECTSCPQLAILGMENEALFYQEKKRKVYQKYKIQIATPSAWLQKCTQNSLTMRHLPVNLIPYSLDLNTYKPYPKKEIRQQLGLPLDKTILLFVSDKIGNKRKGFDLLLESFRTVSQTTKEEIVLCSIGKIHAEVLREIPNHISMGMIHDENKIAQIYSAADVFVIPSREDNLPNVVLESLACGVPVIGFTIGGVPDMVKHNFNGLLCDKIDAGALAATILHFLEHRNEFSSETIRIDAEKRYAPHVQASRYLDLYKKL